MLRKIAVFLSMLLFAGAVITPASFAADKYDVVSSEFFDPFNILGGGPVGYFVSLPTVTCPGHEPTGNPEQPCPVGSRTHTRNAVWVSRVDSPDPNMSGWMTVVLNSNNDASYSGPAWGTFSIALDSGGTWEGTWQGLRMAQGDYWTATLNVQGKGFGGSVDGMKMMATDEIISFTPVNLAYFGSIHARIVDSN